MEGWTYESSERALSHHEEMIWTSQALGIGNGYYIERYISVKEIAPDFERRRESASTVHMMVRAARLRKFEATGSSRF